MKETRVYSTAFVLSVLVHVAFLVALVVFGGRAARRAAEEATSYIFIKLQPPPGEGAAEPKPPAPAAEARKTEVPPPLPKQRKAWDPLTDQIPSPPAYTPPATAGTAFTALHSTVSSEELLSDPQSGQVFSKYFQSVKSRIQAVSARHQSFIVREKGKVTVGFVLNRDGHLISCEPESPNGVQPDRLAVARALDIIRESEPFLRFPPEVPAESISFNITLVFDG